MTVDELIDILYTFDKNSEVYVEDDPLFESDIIVVPEEKRIVFTTLS
jgi:hypothetical protein